MTANDPLFDQRISDWLEADPDQAPPVVLETIVAAFPSIPQRRRTRSLPRAGSSWRTRVVWIAAVVALALIALALLSGVGRTPRPTRTVPSAPVAVAPVPSTSSPRPRPTPTVSPLQGTGLIVFEHFTSGLGTRIEFLQANGLGKELLPDIPGHQERPAWRPDGTKLAFAGWDPQVEGARQAIWESDATGASPTLLTVGCEPPVCVEEWDPSYAVDGTRMVFVRSAGPADAPDLDGHRHPRPRDRGGAGDRVDAGR